MTNTPVAALTRLIKGIFEDMPVLAFWNGSELLSEIESIGYNTTSRDASFWGFEIRLNGHFYRITYDIIPETFSLYERVVDTNGIRSILHHVQNVNSINHIMVWFQRNQPAQIG